MVSKITLMRIRTLLTGVFDIDYVNPFFDAAIDVVFTSPSKKQIRIGGFHYGSSPVPASPVQVAQVQASGARIHTSTMQTDRGERRQVVYDFDKQDLWKARFAPRELGKWKYNFVFRNTKGQEAFDEGIFTCVKGRKPNPGFVRRHPTNPFRFVFDDGSPYFPIGLQDCWGDNSATGILSPQAGKGLSLPVSKLTPRIGIKGKMSLNPTW